MGGKKQHLSKCLKDRNQGLFSGSIRELTVLLTEPAARKPLQMDGVRPFPRQSFIHVLGVTEEGLPIMACREVHLIFYCTNLRSRGKTG